MAGLFGVLKNLISREEKKAKSGGAPPVDAAAAFFDEAGEGGSDGAPHASAATAEAPQAAAAEAEAEAEATAPSEPSFEELKRKYDVDRQNIGLGFRAARAALAEKRTDAASRLLEQIGNMIMDEDPDSALQAFKAAQQCGQANDGLLFNMVRLYRQKGEYSDAEVCIRQVLRNDINNLEALAVLVDILIDRKNLRDATMTCNRMLSINPRDPISREKLGDIHLENNARPEAIKAYLLAAFNYASMQEKADGIRLYKKVLELDPSHPTAMREIVNLGGSA